MIRVVTMSGEIKYQGDVGPRGPIGPMGPQGPAGEDYDDTELRNMMERKVDKETGKGLSTNDYSDEDKNKLNNLPTNPVTEESDPTVPDFVKNITEADIKKWDESGNANVLTFTNLTVEPTMWLEDTTYDEFGYRADITCEGVTDAFFSDVVFGPTEATSGNYAPISVTGDGTVTIYAAELPENSISIPTILCIKGGQ